LAIRPRRMRTTAGKKNVVTNHSWHLTDFDRSRYTHFLIKREDLRSKKIRIMLKIRESRWQSWKMQVWRRCWAEWTTGKGIKSDLTKGWNLRWNSWKSLMRSYLSKIINARMLFKAWHR
jgi:hypothetical protein